MLIYAQKSGKAKLGQWKRGTINVYREIFICLPVAPLKSTGVTPLATMVTIKRLATPQGLLNNIAGPVLGEKIT